LRRNCLLKQIIEGKIDGRMEVTGRRGKSCKELLDDLKEKRGYWKLKQEAADRSVLRTSFRETVYAPVVREARELLLLLLLLYLLSIYSYVPETDQVSTIYSIAAICNYNLG
jgi:hypothetical protein